MANTLTDLIPHAYAALNEISRELIGFIPGAMRNGSYDRAAIGQSVIVPVVPGANVSDISAAMAVPNPTDQTIDNATMKVLKSRAAEFGYTGVETRQLNSGPGIQTIQSQQILEGMRALANEIEEDLAKEAALSSSRAYGTAGTTPFHTNIKDSAQVRKILDDNGAPMSGRQLVVDTSAGASLRSLNQLNRINEAGETSMLRQGSLGELHGSMYRESGQAYLHTKGAGLLYQLSGAHAVGATSLLLKTGTGTVLVGDIITFASDTNKYVVSKGVAAPGTIEINKPGLVAAVAANAAMAIGDSYTANVNFTSGSLMLATRLPDLPAEGDIALDRFPLMDMRSGLVFELSVYPGYRKNRYEVGLSWGVKGIKPEHSAIMLG